MFRGIINQRGKENCAAGCERLTGPPEVQSRGVSVADRFFAHRGLANHVKRHSYFYQLLTSGHTMGDSFKYTDCLATPYHSVPTANPATRFMYKHLLMFFVIIQVPLSPRRRRARKRGERSIGDTPNPARGTS